MNKKTILRIISLVILGIAVSYGTLYYLKQRDMKLWEKMREESKPTDTRQVIEPEEPITQETKENQLKEIEKLKQEINIEFPPTEKTATEQAQDLNIINRQQEAAKPAQQQAESQPEPTILTPEEQQIQKQLEELNKINQQYK